MSKIDSNNQMSQINKKHKLILGLLDSENEGELREKLDAFKPNWDKLEKSA